MPKIWKTRTRTSVPYAIVIVDSKVQILNPKDHLYSQLIMFIKLTVKMTKKIFKYLYGFDFQNKTNILMPRQTE